MHKLQIPAVISPAPRQQRHSRQQVHQTSLPQTTLVLPPDGRLRLRLADKAVHDYTRSRRVSSHPCNRQPHSVRTFRMANARPNIDLRCRISISLESLSRSCFFQLKAKSPSMTALRLTMSRNCASIRPCGPWPPAGHHRRSEFSSSWWGLAQTSATRDAINSAVSQLRKEKKRREKRSRRRRQRRRDYSRDKKK